MAKQLVLAVAGSGKTRTILEALNKEEKFLIVTYTNENLRSLEAGIKKKFGSVPKNVTLSSYFSFLYTFCFRPFFSYKLQDNSYTWKTPVYHRGAPGKQYIRHYLTKERYLYSNRVAKLILEKEGLPKVQTRIEKYFDHFLVDEVQDFAGNDFNFLLALTQSNLNISFVGDFHQHTFDTSRDGNTRKNLHKKGLDPYINEFSSAGLEVDTTSLDKTHRCSPTVCNFITENVGIPIESNRIDKTNVVIVDDKDQAQELYKDDEKIKLFYEEYYKYDCWSNNWGRCKGLNSYKDICVVLNKTTAKAFKAGEVPSLPDSTRNKLYVACSRARGDLYILFEEHISELKN